MEWYFYYIIGKAQISSEQSSIFTGNELPLEHRKYSVLDSYLEVASKPAAWQRLRHRFQIILDLIPSNQNMSLPEEQRNSQF